MQKHLKEFAPFDILPEQALAELTQKLNVQNFPQGSYVFTEGQQSLGCLFLVQAGLAEIRKGSSIVGLRQPGEFFGETVILTGKRYPASVKVIEDLTCYVLEDKVFTNLIETHAAFAGYFNRVLTDRLRDLYQEMVQEQPYETFSFGAEPFKQRLVDIMSSPVESCPASTPVSYVARIFTRKKISSVVVTDPNGKMLGLLSERDLVGKVLASDSNPGLVMAGDIMQKDPPALPANAFFYQALLTMLKTQGKYIVVTEQGRPVGIVTIGDLSRARATTSLTVLKEIESAATVDELAHAAGLTGKITATMVVEKAAATEICEVVSELVDQLTRRLLAMAEEQLTKEGLGLPPADFCWLTMGSGGRREQMLGSDQDNAIIYADVPKEQEPRVKSYFLRLAQYVCDGLAQCGITKCPGNIMASNPGWCQSLADWRTSVHTWAYSPSPDSTRQFTIFLDFRPVSGQNYLARQLRDYTLRLLRTAPTILHHLAKDDLAHKVPLSMFKQVIVEKRKEHKHEVNVKTAACVHVVDCIRIFAMREGVADTCTLDRLKKLVDIDAFAADDAEYYEAALQSLIMFRIRENLRRLSMGLVPDNYINPEKLSKRERSVLRESFGAIERLQTATGVAFQVEGHL